MITLQNDKTNVHDVVLIDLDRDNMTVIEALNRIDAYKANSYGEEVFIDATRRAVIARRTVTA